MAIGQRALVLLNANASDLLPLPLAARTYASSWRARPHRQDPEIVIAFTGAPDEASSAQELVRQVGSPQAVSLAGATTIRQLLIVCGDGQCSLLTTADRRTLPPDPIDVTPCSAPKRRSCLPRYAAYHTIWAGLACSPINAFNDGLSPCTNNQCMQSITVDQVFEEVCRAYEARRPVRSA